MTKSGSSRGHGRLRRSQIISTWGPGSLIDLPLYSAIVAGLEEWPKVGDLEEVTDERLARKVRDLTGVPQPHFYLPPAASDDPRMPSTGIRAWRFPEWFLVQEDSTFGGKERSRRLVHARSLSKPREYDGRPIVPVRFVSACPRGHVDDVAWYAFVHRGADDCRGQLWLDEKGTGGDLSDLVVRCVCKKSRALIEAMDQASGALGICTGRRPWLGRFADERCSLPARLLIRTATNAYFAQVFSVLSLPDPGSRLDEAVAALWGDLIYVDSAGELAFARKRPKIAEALAPYGDDEVVEAIHRRKDGGSAGDRPVKQVELDALLGVPEGYGEEVPIDPDFHARRLPGSAWRSGTSVERGEKIKAVVQAHRLREVRTLLGFTRFEAEVPDVNGEFESDVKVAALAIDPKWFPAAEIRGEGIFIHLDPGAVKAWLTRDAVKARIDALQSGYAQWIARRRPNDQRAFVGGPYVLLHTLSHLLIGSLSMRCGYPASSIRERIYVDPTEDRYGILLYTGSPDSEGTLGGLVQQGRHLGEHLDHALDSASLCSNDPICAAHVAGTSMEGRPLHGAACHGCTLVAETSCEMRNDFLDRALVVPVLGLPDAAFFPGD